jgi:CRISPR/Cas system CMR-associated protein Cmr5 small subunit
MAGQKPPPPSSARKNTIELGFNFFNSKEQNGNDMSKKSRSARPFNRVNDEEWLNEKNKKGDNKFRNAHGVGNYRKNLGYKAEQKFVQKQGKQFAHEKNKEKKRRVYRGGKIETNAVNSRVLFDSSSDEDEVL